jgi:hypothetical protein
MGRSGHFFPFEQEGKREEFEALAVKQAGVSDRRSDEGAEFVAQAAG